MAMPCENRPVVAQNEFITNISKQKITYLQFVYVCLKRLVT